MDSGRRGGYSKPGPKTKTADCNVFEMKFTDSMSDAEEIEHFNKGSNIETDLFEDSPIKWGVSVTDLLERSHSLDNVLPFEEPKHIRDILDVLVSPISKKETRKRELTLSPLATPPLSSSSSPTLSEKPLSDQSWALTPKKQITKISSKLIPRGGRKGRHFIYSLASGSGAKSHRLDGFTAADLLRSVQAADDAADCRRPLQKRTLSMGVSNEAQDDIVSFSTLCPLRSPKKKSEEKIPDTDDVDVFNDSFESYDVQFTQIEREARCPEDMQEVDEVDNAEREEFWGFSTPDKMAQQVMKSMLDKLEVDNLSDEWRETVGDRNKSQPYIRNILHDINAIKCQGLPENSMNFQPNKPTITDEKAREKYSELQVVASDAESQQKFSNTVKNYVDISVNAIQSSPLGRVQEKTADSQFLSFGKNFVNFINMKDEENDESSPPNVVASKDSPYRLPSAGDEYVNNLDKSRRFEGSTIQEDEPHNCLVITGECPSMGLQESSFGGRDSGFTTNRGVDDCGFSTISSSTKGKDLKYGSFSTAGGESVLVSEESLACAKKMIKEINNETDSSCSISRDIKQKDLQYGGFSTAGGKSVAVSEKSLAYAKKIMNEIDNETEASSSISRDIKQKDLQYGGFLTAGGKSVAVSEESLAFAKKIMNEIDNETEGSSSISRDIKQKDLQYGGFSTAGGKSVAVSEESLAFAKKIMNEIDNETDNSCSITRDIKQKDLQYGGFLTAGGKSVAVSEESLAFAKKIMKEIDNETDSSCSISRDIKQKDLQYGGFSTAGGKSVGVSEKGLAYAKKMINEIDNETEASSSISRDIKQKDLQYGGFSTAGGKSVAVSEKSLAYAKKIMNEIDNETEASSSISRDIKQKDLQYGGFSTVGGKSVAVSEKSLAYAKKIMNEIDNETEASSSISRDIKQKDLQYGGFLTAGGKSVAVSEESLAFAKKMIKEIDNETDSSCSISRDIKQKDLQCGGFSTAGGKSVAVSEKSLAYAKKIMNEIDNENEASSSIFRDIKQKDLQYGGFSTAGGKSVAVSEESLAFAKKMMKEIDNETDSSCSISRDIKQKDLQYGGFSTAGGKSVAVSEKSLAYAKKIMNEIDNETEASSSISSDIKKEDLQYGGFSTAGGKSVAVSEESLAFAKKIMNEIDNETEGSSSISRDIKQKDLQYGGFSTAGGKSVAVSEESLAFAKKIMNEIDNETDNSCSITRDIKQKDLQYGGFLTAGGKSVAVSEESLAFAKKIMKEIDNETDSSCSISRDIKQKDLQYGGFSTAGGKSVGVSEKGLAYAKKMINEIDNETEASSSISRDIKQKDLQYGGFSTAGGKSVAVSEKSLAYAKKIMNEIDNETEASSSISRDIKQKDLQYGGFSTVGGKSVAVSEKSLAYAKKIMNEIDNETEASSSISRDIKQKDLQYGGFLTAGGKSVAVSEESLAFAKKMIKEIDNETDSSCSISRDIKQKDLQCGGFSTAGGKSVAVSEKSLAYAKKIMNEIDNENEASSSIFRDIKQKDLQYGGFSTAGGKSVAVSEESLAFAKKMMKEIDNETDSSCSISRDIKQKDLQYGGFSTAGGKSVAVSEKSLAYAKKIMNEIDNETEASSSISSDIKKEDLQYGGFSTAGGKSVAVSEESLAFAKKIMNEIDNETDNSCSITRDIKQKDLQYGGFLTAGGKSVAVSEESLAFAKKIMKEIDNETDSSCSISRDIKQKDLQYGGFLTAGGKSVAVSEESLAFTKKMMDEIDNKTAASTPISCSTNQINLNDVFMTAGGKSIPISDESLTSAKKMMNEVDSALSSDINWNNTKCNFPTAAVMAVPILENSFFKYVDEVIESRGSSGCQHFDGYKPVVENSCENSTKGVCLGENIRQVDMVVMSNGDIEDEDSTLPFQGFCDGPGDRRPLEVMEKVLKDSQNDLAKIEDNVKAEVSECAAALLADEQSTVGDWFSPYVTSPSGFFERKRLRPLLSVDTPGPRMASTPNALSEKRKRPLNCSPHKIKKKLKSIAAPLLGQPSRDVAVKEQEELIQKKMSASEKPMLGIYSRKRKERVGKQIYLRKFVNCQSPRCYTFDKLIALGVQEGVSYVTSCNALHFKFHLPDYYSKDLTVCEAGVMTCDGGRLIPDKDGCAGSQEIEQCFLGTPGVHPGLVPSNWVNNHYRWIVWKLAAMEKSFPEIFGGRCLTPEMVVRQLKYRYDREIDLVQRPILRKILEGDEVASRQFVCCVASIRMVDDGDSVELEVSDGWYSVWATVDSEMTSLVRRGTVTVGTKLMVWAAELANCSHGCDPLQVGDDVRLRLSTNCTRRVRWWTRMGLSPQGDRPPSLSPSSILPMGGLIARLSTLVARVYPVLYMSKESDGKTVFRSWKAEELEEAKMEKLKNDEAELIYQSVWAEVEKEYKRRERKLTRSSRRDIAAVTQPDLLCAFLDQSPDPQAAQSVLSPEQLDSALKYREQLFSDMVQQVQDRVRKQLEDSLPQRNVTKLLKLRVVGPKDISTTSSGRFNAVVTVWRPTEELCALLTENRTLQFTNIVASGKREGILQLATSKQTQYIEEETTVKLSDNPWWRRYSTPIRDLALCSSVAFGELDTLGIVVAVKSSGVTKVFLASPVESSAGRFSIVAVTFWTSLKYDRLSGSMEGKRGDRNASREADRARLGRREDHCLSLNPYFNFLRYLCYARPDLSAKEVAILGGKAWRKLTPQQRAPYYKQVFGWEDTLKEGRIVAACNLQWRRQGGGGANGPGFIPCLFANESSTFSQNPRQNHLTRLLVETKAYFKNGDSMRVFIEKCQKAISEDENAKRSANRSLTPSRVATTPISSVSTEKRRHLRTLTSCMSPGQGVPSIESPLAKRVRRLEAYGEAPPLPPLTLTPRSNINKRFKSPFST